MAPHTCRACLDTESCVTPATVLAHTDASGEPSSQAAAIEGARSSHLGESFGQPEPHRLVGADGTPELSACAHLVSGHAQDPLGHRHQLAGHREPSSARHRRPRPDVGPARAVRPDPQPPGVTGHAGQTVLLHVDRLQDVETIIERRQDRPPRASEAPQGDPFRRQDRPRRGGVRAGPPSRPDDRDRTGEGKKRHAHDVERIGAEGQGGQLLEERGEGKGLVGLGQRTPPERLERRREVVLPTAPAPGAATGAPGRSGRLAVPSPLLRGESQDPVCDD